MGVSRIDRACAVQRRRWNRGALHADAHAKPVNNANTDSHSDANPGGIDCQSIVTFVQQHGKQLRTQRQ